MSFSTKEDVATIEAEMPWDARERPETLYQMLRQTAQAFPTRPAVSYQLFSDADAKAQTLSWQAFHDQV